MDLKALMQKLETINTTQTLTESVEKRVVITESVATPNRRIEEPTFKSSIARSLVEDFGYELGEETLGEVAFTPEQQAKMGKANPQDPYIVARVLGKDAVPLSHFTDPEDQAIAKQMGFKDGPPAPAAPAAQTPAAPAAQTRGGLAKPAAPAAGNTQNMGDGSQLTTDPKTGAAAATDSEGNPYIPGSNPNLPKNKTATQDMGDGSKLTTGPGGVAATNSDGTPYVPGSNPNLPQNKPAAALPTGTVDQNAGELPGGAAAGQGGKPPAASTTGKPPAGGAGGDAAVAATRAKFKALMDKLEKTGGVTGAAPSVKETLQYADDQTLLAIKNIRY